MELLRLRRREDLAVRGHKLLQDKLEGLVARFLRMVADYQKTRRHLAQKIAQVLQRFSLAGSLSTEEALAEALLECRGRTDVEVSYVRIMNVPVPRMTLKEYRLDFAYSLVETPMDLDGAISELQEIFPELLRIAELQEALRILAMEIAKTRRRVNSLRYVIMPQLAEAIKEIKTRLEELDRQTKSQLLKIKEMLEAAS